jgi:hypothetical protein
LPLALVGQGTFAWLQEYVMEPLVVKPTATQHIGNFEFRVVTNPKEVKSESIEPMRIQQVESITRWLQAKWKQQRMLERN